jgi:DivIVA domain-containing protein
VELDRHYIERKDFTVARRGYDQEEVDLHLRKLADAISELKAQLKATPAGVAGAAAEQVRQIVEAAEESAAQIEERANAEARRVTDDASRRAKETRDRADQESAEQLQRVQETVAKMLDRLSSHETELDTLVQGIHEGASGLVDRMRGGAGDLEGELESIRHELLTVRPAEPVPEPEPVEPEPLAASEDVAAAPAGWPDTPEPAVAGNGAAQEEAASEPEPEPEPAVAPPAAEEPAAAPAAAGLGGAGPEGARLVALNMALNGTPREEAARYLADNFQLDDQEAILDDVYSRVGGRA